VRWIQRDDLTYSCRRPCPKSQQEYDLCLQEIFEVQVLPIHFREGHRVENRSTIREWVRSDRRDTSRSLGDRREDWEGDILLEDPHTMPLSHD